MRSIQASVVIPKNIERVWGELSRPEVLQALSEAFAGWGRKFHYRADNGGPLGPGSEISVTTPGGSPILRWRVSSWAAPNGFELVSMESQRGLTSCHMLITFKLESTDTEQTSVTASCVLLFGNQLVELLSLLLPVRFLYIRSLGRALKKLRECVA